MAKNFFKKYFPSPEKIKQIEQIKWLGTLLHDPNLWHLNRHSVSGAIAVGMFMMYMPVPFQMILAALAAIVFRVNLPISVSVVWITNPVTIAPMFYLAYKFGVYILDTQLQSFNFELSLNWLFVELGTRWRPFLLGCFIMAFICSIIGYVVTKVLWRLHLIQRIKMRKQLYLKRRKLKKTVTQTHD